MFKPSKLSQKQNNKPSKLSQKQTNKPSKLSKNKPTNLFKRVQAFGVEGPAVGVLAESNQSGSYTHLRRVSVV